MPAAPAEVTAEFTIHPFREGEMPPHVRAGVAAAEATGLAIEVGPLGTGLSGPRRDVTQALTDVIDAAVDAGARAIHIKIEIPSVAGSG